MIKTKRKISKRLIAYPYDKYAVLVVINNESVIKDKNETLVVLKKSTIRKLAKAIQ